MDLDLLYELAMVAKHNNLSEASRELHLTVPVLSRHLKTVETELGVEIYDRSHNPMTLTPEGELLLPLLCEAGNIRARLLMFRETHRRTHIETVRIRGLVDAATLPILRVAKTAFETANANARVRMLPMQFQTPFEDIRSDDLDVAVEPFSDLIDVHDLEWIHLVTEKTFVVLESTNPFASHPSFGFADLFELPFTSLRSNRDNAMRKHVQMLAKRAGIAGNIPRKLVLSPCDTYDELFMTGLGEYALMMPESLALRYENEFAGQYAIRPFMGEGVDYNICAFFCPDAPAHVRSYLDELRKLV